MAEGLTTLRLRVSPGARRSEFVGPHGGAWKVRVTAPAEDGRAKQAVLTLVAKALALPRRDVSLVSGRTGRDKVVTFTGLNEAEAGRRLGRVR